MHGWVDERRVNEKTQCLCCTRKCAKTSTYLRRRSERIETSFLLLGTSESLKLKLPSLETTFLNSNAGFTELLSEDSKMANARKEESQTHSTEIPAYPNCIKYRYLYVLDVYLCEKKKKKFQVRGFKFNKNKNKIQILQLNNKLAY